MSQRIKELKQAREQYKHTPVQVELATKFLRIVYGRSLLGIIHPERIAAALDLVVAVDKYGDALTRDPRIIEAYECLYADEGIKAELDMMAQSSSNETKPIDALVRPLALTALVKNGEFTDVLMRTPCDPLSDAECIGIQVLCGFLESAVNSTTSIDLYEAAVPEIVIACNATLENRRREKKLINKKAKKS